MALLKNCVFSSDRSREQSPVPAATSHPSPTHPRVLQEPKLL